MGKSNVLGKIIVPRLNETSRYIKSELEEREREEVFRLKRVKQKKEWEKDQEKRKLKSIAETGGSDNRDNPPTPKRPESKSPGGSKTAVSRPPETVNLLILNPRDEPDPTTVSSTFISPFSGKTIPGISQVEELIDVKGSRLQSILDSTEGGSGVGRSKDDIISKDRIVKEQKLNEPARHLVQEITKGDIVNIDNNKNKELQEASKITNNTTSTTLSDMVNERHLKQSPKNTVGTTGHSTISEIDMKAKQDKTKTVSLVAKSVSIPKMNIKEIDKSMSKTGEQTTNKVKNVKGKTNLTPYVSTVSILDNASDTSKGEASTVQKNEENDEIKNQKISDIQKVEHTPAEALLSEVIKDTNITQHKKIMKDAETSHEISMSSIATQYENMQQEQEKAEPVFKENNPKLYSASSSKFDTNLKDKVEDEAEDNWEFVLASDKQADDIKETKDLKDRDTNKDKTLENAASSKQLKIHDSKLSIQTSIKNETDDNDSEDGKKSKDDTQKKRRKRKNSENLDSKSDNPSID